MTFEKQIQKIQNSLFELDCPLAVHIIEEELPEPELKYQILEWLFEKYKTINNETLDISNTTPSPTLSHKKNPVSSRLTNSSSSSFMSFYSPSYSSLESKMKRETSPPIKKKTNPLEEKITNLVTHCAILGCCNMKDAIYFTEIGINPLIFNIYENLIEMINISNYFNLLENTEDSTAIENPLKYPRMGIKNITEEVTKDTEFLNELCRGKNLSILSNKSCGNILSKDLAALVNIDKSENKSTSTTPDSEKSHSSFENKKKSLTPEAEVNQKIDLESLNEKIKTWNVELENLSHEHDLLRAQYKYVDQDEDDNTQVLQSLYTLSQHLATYIESFNFRFPVEIESWIYNSINSNNQAYSTELNNVISRLSVLTKNYQQTIDNIANIKQGYEQLVCKPDYSIDTSSPSMLPNSNKETLDPFSNNQDVHRSPMSSTQNSPLSPFSGNYNLYFSHEDNEELSFSNKNQPDRIMLGRYVNIDSKIKEIQKMENEVQHYIDILVKSQERRMRNNPNLMQIEPPQTLPITTTTTQSLILTTDPEYSQNSTENQEQEIKKIKDSQEEEDQIAKEQEIVIIKDTDEEDGNDDVIKEIEIIKDDKVAEEDVQEIEIIKDGKEEEEGVQEIEIIKDDKVAEGDVQEIKIIKDGKEEEEGVQKIEIIKDDKDEEEDIQEINIIQNNNEEVEIQEKEESVIIIEDSMDIEKDNE